LALASLWSTICLGLFLTPNQHGLKMFARVPAAVNALLVPCHWGFQLRETHRAKRDGFVKPPACCLLAIVYCILAIVYWLLAVVYCLLAIVYWLLAILPVVYWLLAIGYCLLSIGYCLAPQVQFWSCSCVYCTPQQPSCGRQNQNTRGANFFRGSIIALSSDFYPS
jgi:hypothetical protein